MRRRIHCVNGDSATLTEKALRITELLPKAETLIHFVNYWLGHHSALEQPGTLFVRQTSRTSHRQCFTK